MIGDPFATDTQALVASSPAAQLAAPPPLGGGVAINTFGGIVTAQRVAVPRNLQAVMANLKVLCAMNGHRYLWGWEVKKAGGGKEWIEGPTITLANDLVRVYGNCNVDVKVDELPEHTMFYARFTDYETGFSMTRPFRQRRKQNIGGNYDSDRAADMVFQIGASKAIRNVVVNALASLKDYMIEEAKSKLLGWVQANPEKARQWCIENAEENDIDIKRIEKFVGRPVKDWLVRDLARVMTELRGISEGMSSADDVYPIGDDEPEKAAEKPATPSEKMTAAAGRGRGKKAAEEPKPAEGQPLDHDPLRAEPKAETKPAETEDKTAAGVGTSFAADVEREAQATADAATNVSTSELGYDPETGEILQEGNAEPDPIQDMADTFLDELGRVEDEGALELLLRSWQKQVPDKQMAAFQELVSGSIDKRRDLLQRRAARAATTKPAATTAKPAGRALFDE